MTYDLVIIGAGTAGITAYKEARKHSDKVCMIHDGPLGTTCARVGCMPSKALIHPAFVMQQLRTLQQQQLVHGNIQPDRASILAHVRQLRDHFASSMTDETQSFDQLEYGTPHFIDDHHLEVNGKRIATKATILATGTSPRIPDAFEAVSDACLTTDTLFEQADLPERIGVVGMGAIGAEMAFALSALGCEVSAFQQRHKVAGIVHPELNHIMIEQCRKYFRLEVGARVSAEHIAGDVVLTTHKTHLQVDKLLIAAGRVPNLAGLKLEHTQALLDEDQFPAFDPETLKLHNAPIYLAGDVNKQHAILHEAVNEGKFAARHALGVKTGNLRKTPLTVVFTHPNVASVGIRYPEAMERNAAIGHVDFSRQGRATLMQQNVGKLYLYADKASGQLLGAELLAPEGEHLAHLLALAIQQNMTVKNMLQMPFYHPVLEEGVKTALIHTQKAIREDQ